MKAHRQGLVGIERPGAWLLVVGTRELFRQRRRLRRERDGLEAAAGSAGPSASAVAVKTGTVGATIHQGLARLRRLHLAGRLARGAMR